MKKTIACILAAAMLLSLCCACGKTEGEGGTLTEKPQKLKDGTIFIDLSGSGSYTVTIADYVDEKGVSPTYAVRCESDSIYAWDAANGIFTIDAYSVCEEAPVYLDVMLGEELQFTVTFKVTVYDGTPVVDGDTAAPIEVDLNGTGTVEVDLRDYVTYSDKAEGISFKATAESDSFTASVSGTILAVTGVSCVQRGKITVEVYKSGNKALEFELDVNVTDSSREAVKKGDPVSSLDLAKEQSVELILSDYVDSVGVAGLSYDFVPGGDGLIIQKTAEGFRIIPERAGEYTYSVNVLQNGTGLFSVDGKLSVTGQFPNTPINGDFETGSMEGWTGTGDYEALNATSSAERYWADIDGGLSYNKDGEYFLDMSIDQRTGTLTSSYFTIGDSGWVTFKLGSGGSVHEEYMSFIMLEDDGTETEIGRFSNTQFHNAFPWNLSDVGVRETAYGLNAYKYKFDERFAGKVVYIRIIDNRGDNFYAGLTVDSIHTDLAGDPGDGYLTAQNLRIFYDRSELTNDIENGGFEQGLQGWTVYGNTQADWDKCISQVEYFWSDLDVKEGKGITSNKEGNNFWSCFTADDGISSWLVYTLRSPAFVLGGNGCVSFRLGNGRYDGGYSGNMYVSVWKYNEKGEDELIARFNNYKFYDLPGWSASDVGVTCFNLNMVQYYADLSDYIGDVLYFEITDHSEGLDNWAGVSVDDFRTNYSEVPEGYQAQYAKG